MQTLIIGLGSMGQRRIRCLQALGHTDIIGYDINTEAAMKVTAKYNIQYVRELSELCKNKSDAIIISVPPLLKQKYIDFANNENIPCFCEADIQTYSGDYYPSSTMRFNPAIRKIKELLDNGTLGNVYTFTYHCGNHIADWHPGANMKTYYAAQKETGACMEMFCFELSWLSCLFGTPADAKGLIDKKLNDTDISADDVYATAVKFNKEVPVQHGLWVGHANESIAGIVLIDIVSRPAIRELRIVGENGTLSWNWNNSYITINTSNGLTVTYGYDKGQAAEGYNANICEDMYIDEIANYINSIQGKETYAYSKAEEEQVIEMLNKIG